MGRYMLRRLAFALLFVFIVSSAAFVLARLAPGDFATQQCVDLSAAECERLRDRLGLNQSPAAQYIRWMSGIIRFDFGESFLYSRPVGALVRERAFNTAVLAMMALAAATLIGIPL